MNKNIVDLHTHKPKKENGIGVEEIWEELSEFVKNKEVTNFAIAITTTDDEIITVCPNSEDIFTLIGAMERIKARILAERVG